MWVVGIDGCAPMNMTMVKNDMKNKERERFSGNFSCYIIIHDQKTFLHDDLVDDDDLKIFLEKQAAHI